MNISKNLLSLGLIAIISGISTAQTYTATAGTNGTTDIQSDYSMSTGDGASVSVDVPLEFELPKKVAIAVAPNGTNTLPALPEFAGIILGHGYHTTRLNSVIDPVSYDNNTWTNIAGHDSRGTVLYIGGGIYANSSVSITVDMTDFVHESDTNSNFKCFQQFGIGAKENGLHEYFIVHDNNDSATNVFPATANIDDTTLMTEGNQLSFYGRFFPYIDTIDPTDRAGKYTSITTITVSTL